MRHPPAADYRPPAIPRQGVGHPCRANQGAHGPPGWWGRNIEQSIGFIMTAVFQEIQACDHGADVVMTSTDNVFEKSSRLSDWLQEPTDGADQRTLFLRVHESFRSGVFNVFQAKDPQTGGEME
ncbi:unnamed protein product [Pleuronectes platessa]|uniref:Uncharacterized protein n=1 Tax=Pleuronectes platessa TaxID=8262 RepID=A0A9N7YTE6_PLEPL|nr:unnamed protein product [Pleuronectes platessa]